MFTPTSRHHLLQKLFWNRAGAAIVHRLIRYERLFDTVVRNYSLIGDTNGERWLLTLMDEAPLVFDIGFHDGASTQQILRARPQARVVGFDPSRFALQNYQTHLAADPRITFENVALSSAVGQHEFFDYENMCNSLAPRKDDMAGADGKIYTVPVTTLDAYCREHAITAVNFMKVDAEGFDLNVLEGARELLAGEGVDIFMFEFASGWASSKRYLWEAHDYFSALPYGLYHLFNGFLCPLVYDAKIDSSCTLPAMYVGISKQRLARGDISLRDYRF